MNTTFRQKIKVLWLRSVRAYTYGFPVDRGKYRLYEFAKRVGGELPANIITETKDKRKFTINFEDWSEDFIYFFGDYEPLCSEIIRQSVKAGDVCLDVGANFGWYTTLFGKLCGERGAVHSFEPVPQLFQMLQKHVSLNNLEKNTRLNNFGLSNQEQILNIHIFEGQPSGHSSLAGRPDEKSLEIPVRVDLLNNYLKTEKIRRVDFVKVDIEGAELLFLEGAAGLFDLARPPVLLMEMALNTSKNFGYAPNDLLRFIGERRNYTFYKIDETAKIIERFKAFDAGDAGANVLCVPAENGEPKLRDIKVK